jgi:hypothetical protein
MSRIRVSRFGMWLQGALGGGWAGRMGGMERYLRLREGEDLEGGFKSTRS